MTTVSAIEVWSVDKIDAAIDNPRSDLGDLESLAASIREVGIMQPLQATPLDGGDRLLLIAGHRRLASARLAGLTEVEVIVEEGTSTKDRIRKMLIENLHREDLSPLDKARGFRDLTVEGLTQRQIADQVGVSQGMVSKHLSLLKLPEKVQGWVGDGELSQEHAVQIAGLSPDAQARLTKDGPPADWEINTEVRKAEGVKRHAAVLKQLRADGVMILDDRGRPYRDKDDPGPIGLAEYGQLSHVDGKQHTGLDCHAVWLAPDGTVYPACTSPANHPEPEQNEEDVEADEAVSGAREIESSAAKEKRQALEQLRAELADATARRRTWLTGLGDAFPRLGVATVRMMTRFAVAGLDYELVLELLGLPAIEGVAHDERIEALITAANSDAHAKRVLFLSFAAMGEQAFEIPKWLTTFEAAEYEAEAGRFYLEVLRGLGYEPSWIESKYLGLPYEEPQVPGTSSPAAEEGASGASPTITVEAKRGKFFIGCSECGQVGFNTKEDTARERGRIHLREEHAVAA